MAQWSHIWHHKVPFTQQQHGTHNICVGNQWQQMQHIPLYTISIIWTREPHIFNIKQPLKWIQVYNVVTYKYSCTCSAAQMDTSLQYGHIQVQSCTRSATQMDTSLQYGHIQIQSCTWSATQMDTSLQCGHIQI